MARRSSPRRSIRIPLRARIARVEALWAEVIRLSKAGAPAEQIDAARARWARAS